MIQNIIIIGGGVAAINAVKAIREIDTDINVHVIQNERVYPYFRTRLTKSLFDDLDVDTILLQKKEWYAQNNVDLLLGKAVVSIDTEKCSVQLDDGSSLEYSKLLLANGAISFQPPIEGINKQHVYSIRTFEDIQTIKAEVENLKTILHIGGGIQNLEAAWASCSHGKEVVIVEFMDRLMPRQLDSRGSEILKKAVEASNVKVLLGTEVKAITGEHKVNGAIIKNKNTTNSSEAIAGNEEESLKCDMVIYSVGIRPNKKIYENTALNTNLGVIVNEHMQTNLDHVYAAGDIAEFEGRIGGIWPVAIEQGKISGYNMLGRSVSYTGLLPVTTMNAFNLTIFSIGNLDENNYSHTLIEDPLDERSYKRLFIKDSIIIGAIIIGDTKYNNRLKKMVENKSDISNIDFNDMSVTDLLEQL